MLPLHQRHTDPSMQWAQPDRDTHGLCTERPREKNITGNSLPSRKKRDTLREDWAQLISSLAFEN